MQSTLKAVPTVCVAGITLNFQGQMLDISNAACTPQWPKPKQIHCGSHKKAWYSSGAMMSFMAVRVSILFRCRLDLWESAEGVTDMTQQAIV